MVRVQIIELDLDRYPGPRSKSVFLTNIKHELKHPYNKKISLLQMFVTSNCFRVYSCHDAHKLDSIHIVCNWFSLNTSYFIFLTRAGRNRVMLPL